jgi:hypothetical protein
MTPTKNPSCEICHEHSGIQARLNGALGLLSILCGLLAYQVLIQTPRVEYSVAAMQKDVDLLKNAVATLQEEQETTKSKLSLLTK